MKSEWFVVAFHLLGFVLLMQGLFPFSSSTFNVANRSCFDSQGSAPKHVILMVIDALRADYVFNKNHAYHLKSIEQLEEQGKAFSIKLRTHTPTVTLPRLKAVLTGTVPSFWDALFNYNTSRLELDNLLSQYKRRYPEKKIVFHGDNTWTKLFSDEIFDRSYGLQSFFVTDFEEIDLNITNGLYTELNQMHEWDLLIVHYLGLDHIGHASSAFNSFVIEKLAEMDTVIERIFFKMNENDLLLITGDHGMADQGGHGGSSYVETHVPAVFISHQLESIDKDDKEYLQIDLTPTLSALLGIAIPWNNLGIIIENVLDRFYPAEKANLKKCLLDDNRRQLFNLFSDTKLSTSLNDLQLIRDQAMSISNEQDLRMLLLSIVLIWLSTMTLWFNIERNALFSIIISMLSYLISRDLFLSLALGAISCCIIVIGTKKWKTNVSKRKDEKKLSDQLLKCYPLFHIISLFSSSFIEEEHQSWYYFLSTYLLIVTFEEKSLRNLSLLVLARLIRSWNQTGNKWLSLPDIGDYLNANENRSSLFAIHFLSSIIFIYLINKSRRYSLSYIFPLIALIYRWNLFNNNWLSSLTPLLYYSFLILLIPINRFSMDKILFSLLFLQCRPHNSFVIVIHMIFYEYFDVTDARLAFLFSQSAFFHLGNSNSFVTIDVLSGFVGIPLYIPALHGILIYIFTYGLSIIWLLKLSREERSLYLRHFGLINSSFALCVFLQRDHLFVWTVFAPKVFYLCAQTAFHLLLC